MPSTRSGKRPTGSSSSDSTSATARLLPPASRAAAGRSTSWPTTRPTRPSSSGWSPSAASGASRRSAGATSATSTGCCAGARSWGCSSTGATGRTASPSGCSARGRPCPSGPAMLAAKTGATILPFWTVRRPDGTFFGAMADPIRVASTAPAEIARATQAIADALEPVIREAPEQWCVFKPMWPDDPAEEARLAEQARAAGRSGSADRARPAPLSGRGVAADRRRPRMSAAVTAGDRPARRGTAVQRARAGLVRAVAAVLARLPFGVVDALCDVAGELWYRVAPDRAAVARGNLAHIVEQLAARGAGPARARAAARDAAALERLVRGVFRHAARAYAETLRGEAADRDVASPPGRRDAGDRGRGLLDPRTGRLRHAPLRVDDGNGGDRRRAFPGAGDRPDGDGRRPGAPAPDARAAVEAAGADRRAGRRPARPSRGARPRRGGRTRRRPPHLRRRGAHAPLRPAGDAADRGPPTSRSTPARRSTSGRSAGPGGATGAAW